MKIYTRMKDIETKSSWAESKKPIKVNMYDTENEKVIIDTDYLLYVQATLPEKLFLNRMNLVSVKKRLAEIKYDMEQIKAELMMEISKDPELKNQSQRDSQLILELHNHKKKDKDAKDGYQELLKEFYEYTEHKETFENLIEYHKNIYFTIKDELDKHLTIIQANKELESDIDGK
jgi:hypothetical protein